MASSFTIPVPESVRLELEEKQPAVVYTSLASLTAVPTAGGAMPLFRVSRTYVAGDMKDWLLRPGTEAHNPAAGILRPDDYDGVTNAVVYEQQT